MLLVKIEDTYIDIDRIAVIRPKRADMPSGEKIRSEIVLVTGSKYCETVWSVKTPEEVYGIICEEQ